MRLPLLIALALVSCANRRQAPEARADASTPQAAPQAAHPLVAAPVDAKPREQTFVMSVASFKGDDLEECDDFVIGVRAPPDAGPSWAPEDPTPKLEAKLPKSAVKIARQCTEQFADRKALAACIHEPPAVDGGDGYISIDGGAPVYMMAAASFYDFDAVFSSDAQMRLCMKERGEWTAVQRDSREFAAAKHERTMKELRRFQHANSPR